MKKILKIILQLCVSLLLILWAGLLPFVLVTGSGQTSPWASFSSVAYAKSETLFYLDGFDHVFITESGIRYHVTDHCPPTKTAYEISLLEAVRLGFTPCGKCDPPLPLGRETDFSLPEDDPIVYYIVQDDRYHASDSCQYIKYNKNGNVPIPVTLEEALYLEKKPCKHCNPPKK